MRIMVELSWQEHTASDLAGYKILWSKPNEKERGVLVQKTVTALQVSLLVKPGQTYEFRLWPFDVAGNLPKEGRVIKAVYVEG